MVSAFDVKDDVISNDLDAITRSSRGHVSSYGSVPETRARSTFLRFVLLSAMVMQISAGRHAVCWQDREFVWD